MMKFSTILVLLVAVIALNAVLASKIPGPLNLSAETPEEIDFLKLFNDVKDDHKADLNKNQKKIATKPTDRKARQSDPKKPGNSTVSPIAANSTKPSPSSNNSSTPAVTTSTTPSNKKSSGVGHYSSLAIGVACLTLSLFI